MTNFFIIFRQELLLSFRDFGKILANFLFFLISIVIFSLLAQNKENQGSTSFYSISIIWFSLLSCLIFSVFYFVMLAAAIYGIPRFRLPIDPLFIVLGAVGVEEIQKMNHKRKLAWTGGLAVFAFLSVLAVMYEDAARNLLKGILEKVVR